MRSGRCRVRGGWVYSLPCPLPFVYRASQRTPRSSVSIFPQDRDNASLTGPLGGLKVTLEEVPGVCVTFHLWPGHGTWVGDVIVMGAVGP